jgi:DNA polymerase-4
MQLAINRAKPTILHMDLNSAFTTIEQQANPLLRGKPLVVAAYNSPGGCVLAASIEAKRFGIKTGMRVRDAKLLYRDLIVRTPDPTKYRAVHLMFLRILEDYSPNVTPKSIDEAVIDFTETLPLFRRSLSDIGAEIKERFKTEIGEWIFCSIGIGPNRFLAKLGASMHKPDGLATIDHANLADVYAKAKLIDLCGINTRFQARLNAYVIFTPVDFLNAPLEKLQRQVFRSILGYYWYVRLRGWEIDSVDFKRRSYGNSYALKIQTNDPAALARLLMKLCEKTGRRLRSNRNSAGGVHLGCLYTDFTYWHKGRKFPIPVYTTQEIYFRAAELLNSSGYKKKVRELAVRVYDLTPNSDEQMQIFSSPTHRVSEAMDAVNDTYGEFSVGSALLLGMENTIIDRIAFGGVAEL